MLTSTIVNSHHPLAEGPHPSRVHALLMPWNRFWSGAWSRRLNMGGHWFPIDVLIIGLICIAVPYFGSNNIASIRDYTFWTPMLSIETEIPVVYWTIIPYAALYLFYPVTLILCPKNDRGRVEMILAMQGMILATLFCTFFFLFLPTEIDLRGAIDRDSMNALEAILFDFIHTSDKPWNAWPSLHIVHSYLLARMMTVWVKREYIDKPFAKPFLVLLWVEFTLLSISILTTKQHFLFDLITGLLTAALFWKLIEYALSIAERHSPSDIAKEAGWD